MAHPGLSFYSRYIQYATILYKIPGFVQVFAFQY